MTKEKNRGRTEIRIVKTYRNLSKIDPKWSNIKTIIKVYRKVISNKKTSIETAYFISNLAPKFPAKAFNKGVRSHWLIESFHFIKDVTFKEDYFKTSLKTVAENYSIFRNFIINIFRKNGFNNIKAAIQKATNNINFMVNLL